MTELFISKDGITYQEAKGDIEFDFVTIPKPILEASDNLELIERIKISTTDIDTINLLSSPFKIFIKYIKSLRNTTNKKNPLRFYNIGVSYCEYDRENEVVYFLLKIRDWDYSLRLNTLAKEDFAKAKEIIATEYLRSITEF
jgi:hypothetical protein